MTLVYVTEITRCDTHHKATVTLQASDPGRRLTFSADSAEAVRLLRLTERGNGA